MEFWVLVYRRNWDEEVIKGVTDSEDRAQAWCLKDALHNDYEGPFELGNPDN